MARKPAADAARARFAALLAQHLTDGTRPATASGEPWTYTGFAAEVQSSREASDFASPRSVSNWCKGKAFPAEIEPILRALFGPGNRHGEAREALREAFKAARNEKAAAVLSKAKPSPIGEVWVKTEEGHAIDRTARPSDQWAATDPLRQQLQQIIRAHAAGLAERAERLSNTRTWGGLARAAAAFAVVVDMDPSVMPNQLGTAYAHLLSLGRLLETDMRVQKDPACADDPLDADIHGLLTDLVRTAAPWLRGFPTIATWDDEAGRALVRPSLFQPARDFVRIARAQQAISEQDAAEVESLGEAAETESYQGSKAGNRLVGTARNLMMAEAEAIALDRVTAPATPSAARPLGVQRAQATLSAARPAWEAFSEVLSPDLRQALRAAADTGTEPYEGEAAVAATAEAAAPDDVEAQARNLILEGWAPPSPWRPFIRKLDFSFSILSDLSHVAALTELKSLDLSNTEVGDIAPLAALTGLQSLDLSGTQVGDITSLAALTELQSLDLSATQVGDIASLAALTGLQSLNLSRTRVGDIASLAALTGLQSLNLSRTRVGDIAPLAALTAMQSLDLSDTSVIDIAPLAALTALQFLFLSGTQVGDIAPLAALTALQSLDLSRTQVGDIAPLAALTGLQALYLSDTQVGDIAPLAALTTLRELSLSGTQVGDIASLAALTALQDLYLSSTRVGDIAPLVALTGLQALHLSRTPVGDIAPLAALTGLQFLYLSGTQVGDITPLSVLTNLRDLDLTGTQVQDISALSGLKVQIRHDLPVTGKSKSRPVRRSRRRGTRG